jgi:hypothetical protein
MDSNSPAPDEIRKIVIAGRQLGKYKTDLNKTKETRQVVFVRVPIGDIVRIGDYREYADGGLAPCMGTLRERIMEGDKVWRLDNYGLEYQTD